MKLLVDKFEENINELITDFNSFHSDYFFTEKELHSYFYHKCLTDPAYSDHGNFNYIHAEYPTPFKCTKTNKKPYFKDAADNDNKAIRSHIDMVFINPKFVVWIKNEKPNNYLKYLNGIGNEIFPKHIKDLCELYKKFIDEIKEPILLYALEFKYIRHAYIGTVQPIIEINYDIQKLKYLENPFFESINQHLKYCYKGLSIILFKDLNKVQKDKIIREILIEKGRFKHN